jgi:glycosyltransferase involved in cell wall biosynthesis
VTDIIAVSHACVTAINRVIYRELAAVGWAVELVIPERLTTSLGFSRRADPAEPGDPPIHELPLLGENQRLMRYRGLLPLLESRRPRVVLLDLDPGSVTAIEVGLWAKRRGARVVCQSCENMARRPLAGARRGHYKRATRDLGIHALVQASSALVDHVFVLSNDGLRVVSEMGFSGRVSKIPLGFDPRLFHPDDSVREEVRRALGLTRFTVAYFGRLLEKKGVHLLVEALAGLRDRPWQLLLDRFDEHRNAYADRLQTQLRETGVIDRVVLFDAKHDEMPRHMNAADVVVMPSLSTENWKEQYGRVAPEAMACGRLVMAADSGALPELLAGAGLVFPEGDVSAIRRLLLRAMDEPHLRHELGAKAAVRARDELSVIAQRDRMHEVLLRLASPSSRS